MDILTLLIENLDSNKKEKSKMYQEIKQFNLSTSVTFTNYTYVIHASVAAEDDATYCFDLPTHEIVVKNNKI